MTTDRLRPALVALALCALPSSARAAPQLVVSIEGATLRIEEQGQKDRVFPVGVGRDAPAAATPTVMYTGTDPRDERFYLAERREPAFHRGLPYLRLDRRTGTIAGEPAYPFSIHGPVTPTLIWGMVSAGCVRMRPADLRELYRFALRHPGMKVSFVRGLDPRASLAALARPGKPAACADTAIGLRRLRRLGSEQTLEDRLCGGVDHWYALELRGGETISLRLQHEGALRAELYGLRAISTVAEGRHGFLHRVPHGYRFRGARYLRITTRTPQRAAAYTLTITIR